MTYEITSKQDWWRVEDQNGTTFYPCDYFSKAQIYKMHDLVEDEDEGELIEQVNGYGARLSAPGYLDATEWGVYETKAEAKAALDQMYGDDEAEADDEADEAA